MEKIYEKPVWVPTGRGVKKDWHDLTSTELIEAVINSDSGTFGIEGIEPYKVITIIRNREDIPEDKRFELINQIKEKSKLNRQKAKPTSVEWLKD